jgi:hypothetical protein
MAFRTIKRIVLVLFLAALCSVIGLFLMILHPSVHRYGITRLSQEIGCELKTGNIRLNMAGKPGILIQDVHAISKQGKALLSASELILIPNLSELFIFRVSGSQKPEVSAGRIR